MQGLVRLVGVHIESSTEGYAGFARLSLSIPLLLTGWGSGTGCATCIGRLSHHQA